MRIEGIIYTALAGLAVLAGTAIPTKASTVELAYEGSTVWGAPLLARNVSYTLDGTARTHGAGLFRLKDVSTDEAILAFCIDIFQVLRLPAIHDTTSFVDATRLGQIERLYSNFYGGVDTADEAAGFQMALWEIMTDSDSALDLAAGRFVTTGSGMQYDFAADYLAGLGGDSSENWKITTYFHATSQDLVSAIPVTAVPVPATAGLLLLGLVGLGRLRARANG